MNVCVSIVTATFNRVITLPRVYESLVSQTCKDFEWLVVDDGSQDSTQEYVIGLIDNAPFPIRYIYKENGGNHTALNVGVKEAKGQYVTFLDSDDAMMPDVVEYGINAWANLESHEEYFSVFGRAIYENGQLMGTPFPDTFNSLPHYKLQRAWRTKYKCDGIAFARTSILKRHPYPEPNGMKHIWPSITGYEIRALYKIFYTNHIFIVAYQDQENRHSQGGGPGFAQVRCKSTWLLDFHTINKIWLIDKSWSVSEKYNVIRRFVVNAYRLGKTPKDIYMGFTRPVIRVFITTVYISAYLLAKAMGKSFIHHIERIST